MADEYISKQAYNNAIREAVRKYPNTFYNGLEVARQIAHDMDAADVVPVKHGLWALCPSGKLRCTVCGAAGKRTKYCPNCGAYMRDGGKDGN